MRLLITGFEAFPGVAHNPTERLVRSLPGTWQAAALTTAVLPVDTGRIVSALDALDPRGHDAAVHLGVARARARVGLETRAVNRLDFDVPDNGGARPTGRPIDPAGPAARTSRLPLDRMAEGFRRAQVPVERSDDAGRYLCNQLMYLSLAATSGPSGFVHVPPDETLAAELGPGAPFVPFERLRAGLLAALGGLLEAVGGREART